MVRSAAVGLVLTTVLLGCMGPGCDHDAAQTFRQEATGAIGDGVKTIMNGVLDGLIAAVEEAGDGPSEESGS
ncbi:MAG: hypothetical protein AMXMBFR13_40410 [Phycisphaerae bacterium]